MALIPFAMKEEQDELFRNLLKAGAMLVVLVSYGTLAFWHFESGINPEISTPFDAFYWTITVLSTVGFGDITPITNQGKVVFITLAIFGLGVYGYIASSIISLMTERKFVEALRDALMLSKEVRRENHVVLVGWNPFTESAYNEFVANKIPVAVVVEDESLAHLLRKQGIDVVFGDPVNESTLTEAGIDVARCVVLAMVDETKNLLTLLKVRSMAPSVEIVVATRKRDLIDLFKQAGASRVVDAADIAGRILASSVFEPHVAALLRDLAEAEEGLDLREFRAPSFMKGLRIADLAPLGVKGLVLAVFREDRMHALPSQDFVLEEGDVLIFVGRVNELRENERVFSLPSG